MRQEPDHRRIGKQAKLFGLHPAGKGKPWMPFEEDHKHDQSGTSERNKTFLNFLLMLLSFFSPSMSFLMDLYSCFLVFCSVPCTEEILRGCL